MAATLAASLAFPAAQWLPSEIKHRTCGFGWSLTEVPTRPLGLEADFQGYEN